MNSWTNHGAPIIVAAIWTAVASVSVCMAQEPADLQAAPGDDLAVRRVVLLSCDTLSAPEVNTWGGEFENSTTLDSLAQWGVLFKNCLTPIGWTLPAHMSMLTGLSPGVHRVGADKPLAEDMPWVPSILADAGFKCGAFVGANGWMSPIFGFNRGFSTYESLSRGTQHIKWGGRWLPRSLRTDTGETQPFFLFLHYMDVHSTKPSFDTLLPYWSTHEIVHYYFDLPDPPPPVCLDAGGEQWNMPAYDSQLLRRAYNACVYSWDRYSLSTILTELRRHNLEFDTLVIVTADHGEEFGQHDSWLHDSPYGGVRHVPLLISCPGLLPTGLVVDTPVSLMDLAPTILDLVRLPPLLECQGLSLRPLLEDKGEFFPDRDFLIDGVRRGDDLQDSGLVARVEGSWWSLIAATDTTDGLGGFSPMKADHLIALYNLDEDPFEKNNLLPAHPDIGLILHRRLDEAWARDAAMAATIAAGLDTEPVIIPADMRRSLRALGY